MVSRKGRTLEPSTIDTFFWTRIADIATPLEPATGND